LTDFHEVIYQSGMKPGRKKYRDVKRFDSEIDSEYSKLSKPIIAPAA